MSTPLTVSIIIPAFNAARYLAATIESALSQTQPATQIIVVDDGSTDETADIASSFSDAVSCLRQENAGVSVARNHGAAQASADWFLFLDADDILLSDALEKLSVRASAGDCGVVYGETIHFFESTSDRRVHSRPGAEGPVPAAAVANFWKSLIATPGAAIIERELFTRIGGFRKEFNTTADRDLWLRAGMLAQFGFVAAPVIEKREHGENMSGDKNRARQQAAEVQLSFLEWCDSRALSRPPFDERQVFEQNLERALAERGFSAAAWLCEQAFARGISGRVFDRARRLIGMPAFARDLELRLRSLFPK